MPVSKTFHIRPLPLVVAIAMLLLGGASLSVNGRADAAAMTQTMVRLDKLKFSTLTGGRVCAKTANAGAEGKVLVTFPTNNATDYSLAAVGSWTVNTTGLDAGQTAWPGITNATNVSGKTVTFGSGDLTVSSNLYCFNFAAALTTASNNTETTVGNVQTQTAASGVLDTGYFSEGLATDDTITITNAVVPPFFSFSLNANTDSFTSNLATGSVVSTNGRLVTVSTNAANGYVVWAKDSNNNGAGRGSLFSATSNYYINGAAAVGSGVRTLAGGTQDYGLGAIITANPLGGTLSLNANYDSTASTSKAGTLDPTAFQPIASSNGTASSDQLTVTERAAISGLTKSGSDYGDIITIVAAGLF